MEKEDVYIGELFIVPIDAPLYYYLYVLAPDFHDIVQISLHDSDSGSFISMVGITNIKTHSTENTKDLLSEGEGHYIYQYEMDGKIRLSEHNSLKERVENYLLEME